MSTRRKPAAAAAPAPAADMTLTATERPTFPLQVDVEGVAIELHSDGSARGDAKALEAKMRALVGVPNQGSLMAWQILRALQSAKTAPARR